MVSIWEVHTLIFTTICAQRWQNMNSSNSAKRGRISRKYNVHSTNTWRWLVLQRIVIDVNISLVFQEGTLWHQNLVRYKRPVAHFTALHALLIAPLAWTDHHHCRLTVKSVRIAVAKMILAILTGSCFWTAEALVSLSGRSAQLPFKYNRK